MKYPKTKVRSCLRLVKKVQNILQQMNAASKVKELVMNINVLLFKMKKQRYTAIKISTRLGVENALRCSDAIGAMSETWFPRDHRRQQYSINYSVDATADQNSVLSYLQRIDEDCKCSSVLIREEEIDKLADAFIASFHQKMKLEKQQSYRNYEDMLARST